MSHTHKKVNPRFRYFWNGDIHPDFAEYHTKHSAKLRRGWQSQSLLQYSIWHGPEEERNPNTRKFCKRHVAKQHRHQAKKEIIMHLTDN